MNQASSTNTSTKRCAAESRSLSLFTIRNLRLCTFSNESLNMSFVSVSAPTAHRFRSWPSCSSRQSRRYTSDGARRSTATHWSSPSRTRRRRNATCWPPRWKTFDLCLSAGRVATPRAAVVAGTCLRCCVPRSPRVNERRAGLLFAAACWYT